MQRSVNAALMTFLLLLAGCTSSEGLGVQWQPNGEAIDSVPVNDFTLLTSENTTWTFSEHAANTTTVVAFLFTNCLDICPVVTYNMKWIQSQLTPDEAANTTFLTITVDPWRDNVSKLHEWKTSTNSSWTHLTVNTTESDAPSMQNIQSVWENFEVGLSIEENTTNSTARHHPSDYTVNHSTGTIIIDRFGNQRVWWGDNDWILDLFLEDLRSLIEL